MQYIAGVEAAAQRLLEFDPEGAAALAHVPNSGRVHAIETANGPVIAVDGRKLHSGRDPVREAARWVRGLDLSEATVVVILGFGSGYAVRALAERTDAMLIVFEPDIEVLALGLRHGPLPERLRVFTSAKQLGLHLGVRLSGADRGLVTVWTASGRANPRAYADALRAAQDAIGRAKLRHRTACLRGPGWLDHYLANVHHLATGPSLAQLRGSLDGVPAIITAAGPSLDLNVGQLAAWRDHALLLTVNSAARALSRAAVKPHALVSIESADVTAGLEGLPWLTELPAFLELTGNPNLWALPFSRRVALSVDTNGCAALSDRIAPGMAMSAGFCVANAAVAVAHALGCSPIILVGSDLAYAGTRVYATGTMFEEMRAEPSGDGTVKMEGLGGRRLIEERSAHALGGNHMPTTAHTLQVPAWDGCGTVMTTRDFAMFRDWYANFAQVHPDAELINATEGGAFIDGWEHVPLEDVANRLGIDARQATPPVTQRFETVLARPAANPAPVRAGLEQEADTVAALRANLDEAMALVGHDPDGDLTLDEAAAARLLELNATCRTLLRRSPLASEASFVPVEQLRARGEISTYSLYASLDGPLRDLAEKLARVLQQLESGGNHDGNLATD